GGGDPVRVGDAERKQQPRGTEPQGREEPGDVREGGKHDQKRSERSARDRSGSGACPGTTPRISLRMTRKIGEAVCGRRAMVTSAATAMRSAGISPAPCTNPPSRARDEPIIRVIGPRLASLAPYAFVLLWSSSFVTARTGLKLVTPMLFVGVRLAAAALILLAGVGIWGGAGAPLRGRRPHLRVAGALVNGLALAAFHVGLVTVDAAVLALRHAPRP